jgi:potassium efflux system protein
MKTVKFLGLLMVLSVVSASLSAQDTLKHRRRSFQNLFTDADKPTSGEYMLRIGEVHQALHGLENEIPLRPDVLMLEGKLRECDTALVLVEHNLEKYSAALNLRNLQMFSVLLQNVQHDLERYSTRIQAADTTLQGLRKELRTLRRDSLLRQLYKDSVNRKLLLPHLRELRTAWRATDSLLQYNLNIVNTLKTSVSEKSIRADDLFNQIEERLTRSGIQAFSKEYNFLWEPAPTVTTEFKEELDNSYRSGRKALDFYFRDSSGQRALMWLLGIAFYLWVLANLRTLKRNNKRETLAAYGVTYLTTQPLAASLAVMLSLAPLFDLNAPAAYVEGVQFLLMVVVTLVLRKHWPRSLFHYWLAAIVLFLLFSFTNLILSPGTLQRCWMIGLNIAAIAFGVLFRSRVPEHIQLRRFIRVVIVLFIVLNALAIVFNVFGRFSLARILGTAGIFALTQVMGLSVLVKTIIESILLQIQTIRVKENIEQPFEPQGIISDFRKPMIVVALLMWLTVLSINLNIFDPLFNAFHGVVNEPHKIGSTSFTLSSVGLFFAIIWLAHLIQRYLGYFFGDTGDHDFGDSPANRSKLVVTRLVLLGAGYLLAIAASGLPIDKITIVLGALGVGIGLGLQNIVNNFVSGIILIFDRPLKIGDSIEVGSKSGRVKEIGLRSSTLFTADGAEVIIPNGDMLSQQITNWTLSNNHRRIELKATVETTESKDAVIAEVAAIVKSGAYILKKREPVVLVEGISDKEIKLLIRFWCDDVFKADLAESEVKYLLYSKFKERGIVVK